MYKGKIFQVGLSRTGTKSLRDALGALGYKSKHYPWNPLQDAKKHDALLDIPVLARLESVIERYPNAKYIVTERELDSWLQSAIRFFEHTRRTRPDLSSVVAANRLAVYGHLWPTKDQLEEAYHANAEKISRLMKPVDHIVMNICKGDGWKQLCPFLEVAIPDGPFPHRNKRSGVKTHG